MKASAQFDQQLNHSVTTNIMRMKRNNSADSLTVAAANTRTQQRALNLMIAAVRIIGSFPPDIRDGVDNSGNEVLQKLRLIQR